MNQDTPPLPKQLTSILKVGALALLIIALINIGTHIVNYIKLYYATEDQAILNVAITKAAQSPTTVELVLPGNVQAWHEATLYARTNGYVSQWLVDIGAEVKTGDLLAEIATPEVNASLRQAEADLQTAAANNQVAQTTAARWQHLLKSDSVSKQETDEKTSDAKAKAALLAAATANRDRLRDLVSFERIVAPFDGVIMSRTTDIGRLINAGSGSAPLFRIVQTNPLRIYIRVPEYYASQIKSNLKAELRFPQLPDKRFIATLLDTAKAIDPSTRTLLIQLKIDNPSNELLAGSYTEVHLKLPAKNSVTLPVNTLIFRAHGMQVATIDGTNKALLKSITIGKDFGDTVEVIAGITAGESVILNPPDSLMDAQKVRVVQGQTA